MKIKWFGHACFLLTSSGNTRILADPFDEKVGYPLPQVEADIVTISHDHYDHSNVSIVKGEFEQIRNPGTYEIGDTEIKGVSTFHDEAGGTKRGKNVIFVFKVDGLKVCHCGDLGHILDDEQLGEIGEVDVLLLPVGGIYTIDYNGAMRVMKLIKPKVTIPMHYKTKALSFELDGVEKFLAGVKAENAGNSEIEIKKEDLARYPEVIVPDYW